MEELLLAIACLNGKGCAPTSVRYYETHKDIQSAFLNSEQKIKQHIPEVILVFGSPIATWAAGKTASIQLYKGIKLEVGKNVQIIKYVISF
jgi:hypothetical protein